MHTLTQLRRFAHGHDDVPAFHAAYLVATFLAAAVLNLGFFLILIACHMSLDFVKYREVHGYGYRMTLSAMILESIGDFALLLMGLTVAVYLDHTFLLAAASGLVRSELTIIRAVGLVFPKVVILEHFVTILVSIRSYMDTEVRGLHGSISRFQLWAFRMCGLCLALLACSIFFYRGHELDLLGVILHQLIPSL